MRQGDPLSPFLFLVVMEALSSMIGKACSEGLFKGFQVPKGGPMISHLLFADDSLIIGEWDDDNARSLSPILRCFHLCSGLKINLNKSKLYGCGVDGNEVGRMADILGCSPDLIPFTYLGLKVGANMNRVNSWSPVIEVFYSRLSKWKASSLSIGGRVVIIVGA
ncbi:putative mitochondrial protein AtMg01250 [Bidens hawaiensis]|uniref:putative mitochondrial protein AtMg01250 n=1 Tax=Bidens hawaiensis TaxID=980011 RepID=UPI0040497272